MLTIIFINLFFIFALSFLFQVPIFSWTYKSLVENTNIDYISTSFCFVLIQVFINLSLIFIHYFFNLESLFRVVNFYFRRPEILFNLILGVLVSSIFVGLLTIIFNKFVLKSNILNKFLITFVLFFMLITLVPLLFYFYLNILS